MRDAAPARDPESADVCRVVELPDGTGVVVRGAEPVDDPASMAALAEVTRAARERFAAEHPQDADTLAMVDSVDAERGRRGLSWREAAKAAGVAASVLSRLQQGTAPDGSNGEALAAWLRRRSR